MELRQLRYFIAAARKESFRKAAEELHVAQSALSRRIAELEAQLGVELFIRRKRRVYLSPAGHFYLSRIEPLVSGIEGVSAHLRQFGSGMSGELTIGYHAVAGRHEVTSTCLAQCRKLMPEVDFFDEMTAVQTNNHLRRRPATEQTINSVDPQKALAIYKQRFADASGFTFISGPKVVGGNTTFTLKGGPAQYYVVWITDLGPNSSVKVNEVTALGS